MIRSGISIIIAIFFMASCSGCLNQNKPENKTTETENPIMTDDDSSDLKIGGQPAPGTNNDSVIRLEPAGKVNSPFSNQKLDNSPEIRNTAEYHYKRGLVLFTISKYEDGIKEFDTVISMDPKMGKAYINRGSAWMELKKYQEAARDFQNAIGLSDSDSTAYLNLGLAYLYQGNFTGAIEANTKLIGLSPKDAKAFFNRGFAYAQIKDFRNAINDFDQAIRINPSYHEAYFNRGLAYFFSNNKTAACRDWELAKQYGSSKAATAIEKECK